MVLRKALILLALYVPAFLTAHAQAIRISGNVHDTEGNALPYTTVRLKGLAIGCITDNNGNFSFNGQTEGQTLVISSVGFKEYSVELSERTVFPLDVTLMTETFNLDEVVIKPERERYRNRDNPAVELIEGIIKDKEKNNPFNNEYVSRNRYETYVVALDNFTKEKQQQGLFRKFQFLSEYIDTSLVSGKPILNVSTREMVATDYYRMKPRREKQVIHGREWVGVEDFLPDEEVKAAADATLRDVDLFNDKVLILRMRNTIYLDAGGIKALEQAKALCDKKGITIVISGIHTQPYILLEKTGMADKLGRENIFDNITAALDRCRK